MGQMLTLPVALAARLQGSGSSRRALSCGSGTARSHIAGVAGCSWQQLARLGTVASLASGPPLELAPPV
eukprot:5364571-Amphidinium_carterae.1